jgi:hypothetical protein
MAYNPQNANGQTTMANSAPVVIASNQTAVPVSGTFYQATQPVSLASLPALATGSNAIGSITNTSFAATQATATNLRTAAENYQGGSAVSSSNPLYVTSISSATGGDTTYHLVSAASVNATNIKASAGVVTGWYIYNSNANARKVAFHNTAGTPTAGASIFYTIVIPGLAATNVSFPNGLAFSTGIAITTVTGLADSDATAVALNDLVINIFYK